MRSAPSYRLVFGFDMGSRLWQARNHFTLSICYTAECHVAYFQLITTSPVCTLCQRVYVQALRSVRLSSQTDDHAMLEALFEMKGTNQPRSEVQHETHYAQGRSDDNGRLCLQLIGM